MSEKLITVLDAANRFRRIQTPEEREKVLSNLRGYHVMIADNAALAMQVKMLIKFCESEKAIFGNTAPVEDFQLSKFYNQ